jgi:hypothetical protein
MGAYCFFVLTLLMALEAYFLRGRGEHVRKFAGVGRMAFNALSLAIWLVHVLFYILVVTGDAEITRGILQGHSAGSIHLVTDLAPALGHGLMDNLLDKTGAVGAVGRMAHHASGLHRVTPVCRYKGLCTCIVTGNAGLILLLQEQNRIVRGMTVVACLTALYNRGVNVGLHDGLSFMAQKTGVLPFRLEQTRKGSIVNFMALVALALSNRFVDRCLILDRSESSMTGDAEIRLVLSEINPPDKTVGDMAGCAIFLFHRGMHGPGEKFLAHLLVAFQTLLS